MKEAKRKIRSAVLAACLLLVIFIPAYSPIRCSDSPSLDDAAEILLPESAMQPGSGVRSTQFQNYGWSNGEFTNYYGEPEIQAMEYDEKRNVLYLGTTYGLMTYNLTTEEKLLQTEANGLLTNSITAFALDETSDILYIGTRWLSILNLTTGEFTNKTTEDGILNGYIYTMVLDNENKILYTGHVGGFCIYNLVNNTYKNITMDDGLLDSVVNALAFDSTENNLYVATRLGLSIYNLKTNILITKTIADGLLVNYINSLEIDPFNKILYVGTQGGGLSIYNITTKAFVNQGTTSGLRDNNITTLKLDTATKQLYIGVGQERFSSGSPWSGLSIYDIDTDTFTNKSMYDGMPSNKVLSLELNSKENQLYIGTSYQWDNKTYGSGLSVYDIESDSFTNIELSNGLPYNTIAPRIIDNDKNIIYMNSGRGLVTFNLSTEEIEVKLANVSTSFGIDLDFERQVLYVGGREGLNIYDIANETLTIKNKTHGLSSSIIYDGVLNERADILYISTFDGGLNIYNTTTDTFENRSFADGLLSMSPGTLLLDDLRNVLYIATGAGLNIYNTSTDVFTSKTTSDGLPNSFIRGMELDRNKNVLYISTNSPQLSIYDVRNDSILNIPYFEHMAVEAFGQLILVPQSNLLLMGSSWDGLFVFDTVAKRFLNHFEEKEGLPSKEAGPFVWDNTGQKLYIGSSNGLSIFDPVYLPSPILYSIATPDIDGNYSLSWSSLWNADNYTLEESNNSDFVNSTNLYCGRDTSFEMIGMGNGIYYYRVRASNFAGDSNWSKVVNITVVRKPSPPILDSFISLDTDGNYTVSWSIILNADNYTLEESAEINFTVPMILYFGSNTTFNVTNKPNGTYYYRVKAMNLAGDSDWSNVETLNVSITFNGNDNKDNIFILSVALVMILVSLSILLFLNKRKKRFKKEKKDEESEGAK